MTTPRIEEMVEKFRKEFEADRGFGQVPQYVPAHYDFRDYEDWLRQALTQDRQATAQVLYDLLEGEIQDEYPTEDGVPVETYGYEQTHNQAIRKAQALIRQTLDPISNQG